MKLFLILGLLVSFSAHSALNSEIDSKSINKKTRDCSTADFEIDALIKDADISRARANQILAELSDRAYSPRAAKARLIVVMDRLTTLDDSINAIENACSDGGWSVQQDIEDAEQAARDEANAKLAN